MTTQLTIENNIQNLQTLVGKTLLYKEKAFIREVTLLAVDISEEDCRLHLYCLINEETITIGASWEYIHLCAWSISCAGYISWKLITDLKLVAEATALMAQEVPIGELMTIINLMSSLGADWQEVWSQMQLRSKKLESGQSYFDFQTE
jgi:hypothetical protein